MFLYLAHVPKLNNMGSGVGESNSRAFWAGLKSEVASSVELGKGSDPGNDGALEEENGAGVVLGK